MPAVGRDDPVPAGLPALGDGPRSLPFQPHLQDRQQAPQQLLLLPPTEFIQVQIFFCFVTCDALSVIHFMRYSSLKRRSLEFVDVFLIPVT